MASSPPIHRPIPKRTFNHSAMPHQPPSPLLAPASIEDTPSRTHSILNLTSSTLLGIYSPTDDYPSDREELSTPWGTGAESPQMSPKPYRRKSVVRPAASGPVLAFSLVLRGVTLFCLGMLYGLLVKHLHNDRKFAPFPVEGIIKPTSGWRYLTFWGVAGVALGSLLPWVDTLWDENESNEPNETIKNRKTKNKDTAESESSGIFGADWTPVIRSVGAFVGIAFAIRKLPWTSTLQASLTLALVNPVLWYIIDRSKPGFVLSVLVGAFGSAVLLLSNPDMMPSPAASSYAKNGTHQHLASHGLGGLGMYVSRESIEGGIWILSVLFCSCVCFGNIGRRLALSGGKNGVGTGRN